MVAAQNLWERMRQDMRGLTERTRRGTKRALEQGVLRVDLVSLRRTRTRALADLGERTLKHWAGGRTAELPGDPEAIRILARIAEVDGRIREKEAALARLRAPSSAATAEEAGPIHEQQQVVLVPIEARPEAADTEETNGIT
jgi:hypothetical protein